jgi:hypothetical protein
MVRECIVTPSNFIYPLFIHEEDFNTPIPSMPGCERHSLDSMLREVGEAMELGVKTFVLFPKVPDELKTNLAEEAYNPDGIVPRAIRMIKKQYPDSVVCTDVALDPYSNQGHDGVVEDGKILNDVTVNQLCKQVICQARAGADIVAPSDMMVRRMVRELGIKRWILMKFCFFSPRTVVLRPFAMPLTRRGLLMFPFFPTQPSMPLLTTVRSVMPSIPTLVLVIRRLISRILPMVARP